MYIFLYNCKQSTLYLQNQAILLIKLLFSSIYIYTHYTNSLNKREEDIMQQNPSIYRLPFQYENDKTNNLQKIKLYMSQCQQPIPDIVNQNEDNIYSHFKFYFNDHEFMIQRISDFGDADSALHEPQFQVEINALFETWKNNKQKSKVQLNKNQSESSNHKTHEFQNFIAFAQYWIKNTQNIYIKYSLYDQLVKDCINTFMDNQIYVVAFKIGNDQKPFKLKQQPKINKKIKITQEKCESLLSTLAQKRLKIYFHHFSKMKNLPSAANNSTFSKNGKTFEELGKSYTSINLAQWICFVKGFQFDNIFQQVHKNRQNEQNQIKKKNNKQYLPVKNVKWNSSLHYFKNLFQKFCDNSKQLIFEAFTQILKKLFTQIFPSGNQQKDVTAQQNYLQFSQKCGIQHLKLSNEEQFNNKLRSFGIFVPQNTTRIIHSETKSYGKIKPKYLGLTEPTLLSKDKIKQATKMNSKINQNTVILPSIRKKPVKYYTISQLMQRNNEPEQSQQNNLNKSQNLQKQNNLLPKNHDKMQIMMKLKQKLANSKSKLNLANNQQNNRQKPQKSGSKTTKIHHKASPPLQQLQTQQVQQKPKFEQQEQDEYLNQYYDKNKSNLFCNNSKYNTNLLPKTQTYHVNKSSYNQNKQGRYVNYEGTHLGNGYGRHLNILRKIDERIDKIHHKLL